VGGYYQRSPNAAVASQCIEARDRSKIFEIRRNNWNHRNATLIGTVLATPSKVPRVFETLLKTLARHSCVTRRPQGVALLSAARELYGLTEVAYACTNIPILKGVQRYSHCVYTSAFMGQWVSPQAIGMERDITMAMDGADEVAGSEPCTIIVLKLPGHVGEAAFFGMTPPTSPVASNDGLRRQLRVLGSYFHEHILRLHGHQSEQQILLSARELDCLRWTAEGKTAWEASVILGITERTVRFHLNAAREKLQCTTTAQAVAKAVRDNMIDL
jgi:DNA-binding CsgD family transcriptional regulator